MLEFHAAPPGLAETGLWCPRCLKPSVVRIPLNVLAEDDQGGTALWTPGWDSRCQECGQSPILAR